MRLDKHNRYLGIMVYETKGVPPFQEKQYCRKLCLLGERAGLRVFVFSPLRMDLQTETVPGYTYCRKTGTWIQSMFPVPNMIYDRCFIGKQLSAEYRAAVLLLRKHPRIRYLGNPLCGKWGVQLTLLNHPEIARHLPQTELYRGISTLIRWLRQQGELFMKPQGGSHGKGALYVSRQGERGYIVKGRDRKNRPLQFFFNQPFALFQWVKQFIGDSKYLQQRYLSLTTENGTPFDIRSLVQKNGQGRWQLTGIALRVGSRESVTSNLHGGGHAEEAVPFLTKQYGSHKASEIVSLIQELSVSIPDALERQYGRLAELGIDFGIDRGGHVWILEVNSKPGRSVFSQLNNRFAEQCSIKHPIEYASYLLERQLGGNR